MADKQIIIDGECLRCGAKTKKHILVCEKCTEEMGTVIAHKFTIDKQTREIKQLKKQLLRKEQELEYYKIQFNADTKEMDGYQNEIGRHIESIEYLRNQLRIKEQEIEELKNQLESTKGLVTVGNKQLAEALLELQKYQDNEQQEKELQKLYNKFEGSSLIEKSVTNEQRP